MGFEDNQKAIALVSPVTWVLEDLWPSLYSKSPSTILRSLTEMGRPGDE
jgi:hypothetical protein